MLDSGFTVCALLCIVNAVIGVALLRNVRWASFLGTANMALQVPAVNSHPLTYAYIGLGDVFAFAKLDPSSVTYLFGPAAFFYPGTFSAVSEVPFQGVELYFGILAAIMTAVMASNCRRRPQ